MRRLTSGILKLSWVVIWFLCQRLMMAMGLLSHDSVWGTLALTLVMYFACFLAIDTWFIIVYLPWVLFWGIKLIMAGAWLPGILVWVFHYGLYVIFVKTQKKP